MFNLLSFKVHAFRELFLKSGKNKLAMRKRSKMYLKERHLTDDGKI